MVTPDAVSSGGAVVEKVIVDGDVGLTTLNVAEFSQGLFAKLRLTDLI